MEVMVPIHDEQDIDDDFDFNSARSSPYPTSPSTPRGFGNFYTSAPTTPSRLSAFYQAFNDGEFNDFTINNNVNGNGKISYYYDNFAFDATKEEMNSNNKVVTAAADLFEGGIIKPINNKPPIHPPQRDNKYKNRNNSKSSTSEVVVTKCNSRGREFSSSSKRETRSLSPLRVSEHAWEEIEDEKEVQNHNHHKQSPSVAKPSSKGHRKWRFKDLFLFRSASEGRASEKDNLKKHSLFSISRKRAPNSAQELKQEKGGGAKEEMKKKTYQSQMSRSFWK